MSVEALLEQALRDGRFSPFAGDSDAQDRNALFSRLRELQARELPTWEPLEDLVQEAGALKISRRDANTLYFCDQLFEHCQAQTDLEQELLPAFLQLRPLLAAVMLRDPAALQSFQHPLYQLLDQLWDASRYWSPELGRQGEKYRARLDETLQQLRSADAATAPFQAWLDELSSQVAKDFQRAELLATRICQAERGALASQHAESIVKRHINPLLTQQPIPEIVEELFKGPFRHSLQLLFLNQGADSDAWIEAMQTAELLLESIKQPENEQEKQRIYQLISKIPVLLAKTLVGIGDPAELENWQRAIESLHMQMLLDGKLELRDAEPLSILDDENGVTTNISAALLEQVAQIPEGQWLIYRKDSGENLRCRLAMKMEDAGQLLFVNVLGAKCLQKSLEEFAYLLAARHVMLLNADNNFSQILRDTVSLFLQLHQRQTLLQADASERQRQENERRRQAQEKARQEAERIAQERLAAQARAEEEARRLAEEQAKRAKEQAKLAEEAARKAADEARRAADEARRAAEEASKHAAAETAKQAAADAARKQADIERERERLLLEEKQARITEWEETLQSVRTLGVGAWVEMEIQGTVQKCKLAAVINASDKLIFVGRDGRKLAEPRRDELIKLMLDGKAAIIERGDQFESSLAKVIQTLRKD